MTFGRYLESVALWVDELTDGEIDLHDLPDEVDLGECYADNLSPRSAAIEVLEVAGFFDFTFPSDSDSGIAEDAGVGYFEDGSPIGG